MITIVLAIITFALLFKLNQLLGLEVGFKVEDKQSVDPLNGYQESKIDEVSEKKKLIQSIARSGIHFDETDFLTRAQQAFKIIFKAYADGDKQTLKDLLSPKPFKAFSLAIDDRNKNKEVLEGNILQFVETELIGGNLSNGYLYITVKFVTDQITVLKDMNGSIVEGDPNYVETITEIWEFSKSVNSSDPRWFLNKITSGEA